MTLKLRPIKRKYRITQNTSTAHLVKGSPVSKTDVLHLVEYERLISDDDRRNKKWKPVTHEKFSVELLDPASYISWDDENAFKQGKLKATGTSWFVLDVLDTIGKKSKEAAFAWMADNPVDWDKVARTVVPDLRNEFNTINFLLELDDIPKMGKNLIDRKNSIRKHFSEKELRGGAAVEATRAGLTDAFLEYQLGYKPLISDIETLWTNFDDLFFRNSKKAKRIDRAFKKLGSGLTGSAVRGGDGGDVSQQLNLNFEGPRYIHGYMRLGAQVLITVRDHIKVRGSFGGPNPIAQFLDMAGIYPDLHTLWNALPFSFIVDYVLPVGDTLESQYGNWSWQTVGLPGGGISLVEAMTSIKIECNFWLQYSATGHGIESFTQVYPALSNQTDDLFLNVPYGKPGRSVGKYSYYERFLQPLAELDGIIDLESDKLLKNPKDRQIQIVSGILMNGALSGGRKTRSRLGKIID